MCLALLGITACKKENDGLTNSPEKPTHSYTGAEYIFEDFDPSDESVNDILQAFHTQIDDGYVGNREISEALWTLEAYLGYKLSNFTRVFESFESHTYMVELRESSSGVDALLGDSILAAYNKVLEMAAELSPLSVFMIDLTYDSYDAGIHRFGVELIVGDMAEEERPEGIAYFSPSNTYSPVGSSCVSLVDGINLKLNAGKYYSGGAYHPYNSWECGSGGTMTVTNVNYNTLNPYNSCCGGGGNTYFNQYKLYYKVNNNNCIGAGNTTDNGSHNTANGWLNEAFWIWDDENSKLSGDFKVLSLHYTGETYYNNPNTNYWHEVIVRTGKTICVGPFN